MTDIIDPVLQARALQELARKLRPDGKVESTLFWENDHGTASVTLGNGQCVVSLFDGQRTVDSLSEAGEILRAIFADEIAVVRAYANESLVYCGLAPAQDPSAAFNTLATPGSSKSMPDIDYVDVATWSRGYHEDSE